MREISKFKKSILVFYLTLISLGLTYAQNLDWQSESHIGLVYQISNKEAQKLLSDKISNYEIERLLHTQIDTFETKKGWSNKPNQGHFLMATAVENQLHCEYTSVFPYQVFLMKAYDALSIQVLDLDGEVRTDAKVKFRWSRIPLDHESKTYRLENAYFRGERRIITVELEGFRSVFRIDKHDVPYRYNYPSYDSGPDFYSYMITDKNRYRPNDPVRFKSYALSGSKIPLRKELELWLINYSGKNVKLKKFKPHRPGSYADEFYLHDSLNLTLDRSYRLQLREKRGRIVAQCSFHYEDYELFGNRLTLDLAKKHHYYPDPNELTITATDVNGLMLKDAKANVLVKNKNIRTPFEPVITLQDTLLFKQINLDPLTPTKVTISPHLFKKANTSYEVYVSVLNSENERVEERLFSTYSYHQNEIVSKLSNDSICFELLKNGISTSSETVKISYNGTKETKNITLPYKEKLNPAIISFNIESDSLNKQISLWQLNPKLELLGGIEKDSFNLALLNPQQLDVSWFVYQGSTLLEKGFGKEVEYKSIILDRSRTYYVELLYSFGGQDQVKQVQYKFKEDFLDVNLDIPDKVFPGQEVNATISVKNSLGNPVSNVDLTALAVTRKLGYHLPDLPYYGERSSPRSKKAHYSKNDLTKRIAKTELNYDKWRTQLGLDSMSYYQFTYPDDQLFKHIKDIEDSTQFSIYAMDDGLAVKIHAIEVNQRPVYYAWTNQPKKYAFYVPKDTCEIILRLDDSVIILDTLIFDIGKKTILSLDINNLPQCARKQNLSNYMHSMEKRRYNMHTAAFGHQKHSYAYLESAKDFVPVFEKSNIINRYNNHLVGPIIEEYKTYHENTDLKTTYKHQGGFNYSFEDNIVYKQDLDNAVPDKLYYSRYQPKTTINDLVINKKDFIASQNQKQEKTPWYPEHVDIVDARLRVRIDLPSYGDIGVSGILFENCITQIITIPCYNSARAYTNAQVKLPLGNHNVIIIYDDGTYLKMDSIAFLQNTQVVIDFNNWNRSSPDERSVEWLQQHYWYDYGCYIEKKNEVSQKKTSYKVNTGHGNISGLIVDTNLLPLPGATIIIEGTQTGTVSDIDGFYSLRINDYSATIKVSFIGYETKEIEVIRGSHVDIEMSEDMHSLEEVVVVGYGISSTNFLSGSVAGVNISSSNYQAEPEEEIEDENIDNQSAEDILYQELLTLNSIRSDFSDVGFWEPKLYTDRKGQASFKVKFPDDVTRWDALVYAMNKRLQTGTERKSIQSYKPLMAELRIPRFLTIGDSANLVGKVSNYTSDTVIAGKVNWTLQGVKTQKDIQFQHSFSNTAFVNPTSTDSLTARFTFKRDDGYTDGEERMIPVVKQGITRADGFISILRDQETIDVSVPSNKTKTIEVFDNQWGIYSSQMQYLIDYRYACNEQLASKLIGLLNQKLLKQYEQETFTGDRHVKKIIKKLLKNQNSEFLWSWWNVSGNTSYWISAHILNALHFAQDSGYEVNLNLDNLINKVTYKFDYLKTYTIQDIELVRSLALWNADIDYIKYINVLDSVLLEQEEYQKQLFPKSHASFLTHKLLLLETKQLSKLPYQLDSLMQYKKESILGEISFSDSKKPKRWYYNKTSTNTIAYRIIKNDSTQHELIEPMQLYFLSSFKDGGWNTYHSSNLLMNVLPDLLATGYTKESPSTIKVTGKDHLTVSEFPYQTTLLAGEELSIKKMSGIPLFYQEYTYETVTTAKTGVAGFEIKTYFENALDEVLEAGQPVKLIAEIDVQKDASFEYVMIEVPIPASCSYYDKRKTYRGIDIHREYFKDRTVLFCEKMKEGNYKFEIELLPRFTGKYMINPAQISLMYVPVVNANTDTKIIKVKSTN